LVEPLTGDDPREVAGYQLRARVGSGGMGRVYLAFTRGGRPVAIKVVRAEFGDDEEFRDRFRQEVLAAQRVHGLYTAQVLDADPDARQPWLATAYVPGMSLRQAVTDHGPLPEESVFLLVAGIAEALQAIHAAGIVHRDLTPSNVILAVDGPRVIDFGIARAAAAPALTRSGIRVGSPRFMAPEQARGRPTTPSVDVFALGSLATYAAAGRPPFGGGGTLAVLYRVLNEAPDLDGCPPDLWPLIERCLAKDPALRPQPREIIDTCRARTADGALAFERSWLPAAVSAVAAGPLAPLVPGMGSGLHDASAGESTFPGDGSYSGPGSEGEDTFSGEVRDPPEGSASDGSTPGAAQPAGSAGDGFTPGAAQPAGSAGDGFTPGAPQPEAAPAGPDEPGVARPPAGRQAALLAAGIPEPPGTSSAGRAPGDGQPRAPRKTVVGWSAAAAALVATAAVVIFLLLHPTLLGAGDHRPRTAAYGSGSPAPRVHPTAAAKGALVASPLLGPDLWPSAARPRPGFLASQAPAMSPSAASPSAPPPQSGRAAFGGTWSGTVSQPGWRVPSWTVELVIPAAGRYGSYSAPSLGCSGTLIVQKAADANMTAIARTTSTVYPGCVVRARLFLTLSGSNGMSMTWIPVRHPRKPGTAVLARS
jgi:hypothetical protein